VVLDPLANGPRRMGVLLAALAALAPGPVLAADPVPRPMALRDSVLVALERNLDLEIERAEPVLAGFRVEEAKAEFDPSFQWSVEYADSERFANSVLEQNPLLDEDGTIDETILTPRWDLGGRAVTGTEYSFTLATPVQETNSPLRLFDRAYTPQLVLGLRQPLLRSRSRAVNRVRIRQAENLERQSSVQLLDRMLQLIQEVERGYWTTVHAQERLRIAHESLRLAESLIQRLERMVDNGLAKEFDLLRPRLEAERRRSDIARAEADLDIARTRLRALVDPALDPSTRIEATDPAPDEAPSSEEASLDVALSRRPEIRAQELTIRNLELDREYADDQARWRFDAFGRAGYSGLAGEDPGPLITQPVSIDRDGYFEAFKDGAPSWAVGVDLHIPFGRRELLARTGPARVRLDQERLRLQALKNRVAVDLETAQRDVAAEWERLGITRRSTVLAREQYETQAKNMETGLATALQVIEAQEYMTEALDAENTARWRYALARSRRAAASGHATQAYELRLELDE
jgi:outer membrane protein TolC